MIDIFDDLNKRGLLDSYSDKEKIRELLTRFSQLLPSLTHSGRKSYRHFSRQKRPRFVSLPQTAR